MSRAAEPLDWVAAVLRGDSNAVERLACQPWTEFLEAADRHGVVFLVDRILRDSKRRDALPAELSEALSSKVRCEQSVELVRCAELRRVLDAFHSAGISSILFKGAALAYTHYQFPHLRPRLDTDLLVAPDNRFHADYVLQSIGYTPANAVARHAIFTQAMYCREGVGAVYHVLDLHWSTSNRPLFRDLFSFDELQSSAVPVLALRREARTLDPIYALLLACIHPVAHHHCDLRLIWLYDVALVAERLDAVDWARFRELATSRKVSFLCRRTFELVARYLGERPWMYDSGMLSVPDERRFEEPSAAFLDQNNTARQDLLLDLWATAGVRDRVRLVFSHAFPDTKYMRAAYGASGWFGLGRSYAQRFGNACVKLIFSASATTSDLRDSREACDP